MRTTYEVSTGHENKWWWIEIHDVKMGYSQAKTFRQVEAMSREVISLLLSVPEDSFDINVTVRGKEGELLAEVEKLDAAAEMATSAARRMKAQAVKSLKNKGLPVRDVAEILHISTGWVQELSKEAV